MFYYKKMTKINYFKGSDALCICEMKNRLSVEAVEAMHIFFNQRYFVGVYFHKVVMSHRTLYGLPIKHIFVVVLS